MAVLAVIQYYLHLIFAEVVLSTKGDHRLPGYVGKYFGKSGKRLTMLISLFSDYGVLITYIIIGGLFAHQLLSPYMGGSILFYTSAIFLIESFIVYFGLKLISEAEFAMTLTLVIIMLVIIFKGLKIIDPANFMAIDLSNIFLPYGPIFFAVGGSAAIPEVCKLLAGKPKKIKSAIAWGTFGSAVLMLAFVFVVVGITGANTSPDSLVGLAAALGSGLTNLLLIFGLLVVASSMIIIAQSSREIFWWDFGLDKNISWALTCFIPFWLYLIGLQNLTKTVSLTGAVSGGILGIVVIILLLKIKKKCELDSPVKCLINSPIALGLSVFFILGLFYEVWNVFFNNI
jgi:amino acid permease